MNKHCYRLIFSKKLGFLIPVAETTCAAAKPGQSRGASSPAPTRWLLKALPLALLGILPYTNAQIVIAPDHRAQIIQSANGVPVMEINNPNSNGLSHNKLNDFNVANPGIIFNNSMRDGTSQIGGHVMRNAKLTREARAILAEVTGNNASRIEGTLEVFGGRADLFIAKDKKKKKKTPAPDADTPSKAKPDAPDAPDSPTTPAKKKPATPDTPDSPDTPPKKKPATPDTPSPTKPATPDAPSSTKPATPDTPSSTKPTTPDAPSSTKPATPDTPSSSKPATPDAPSTTKPAADTPDGTKPAADTASPTKPQTDSNARHMTVATTGGDLKKATTQLNSANSADQASLKNNPVPVTVRGADGKLTTHIVSDAASLKALNGMQVVTGEYAENVNRGSGMGQSSKLYIKVTPQPGGGFTTSFTSSPPKPLK